MLLDSRDRNICAVSGVKMEKKHEPVFASSRLSYVACFHTDMTRLTGGYKFKEAIR